MRRARALASLLPLLIITWAAEAHIFTEWLPLDYVAYADPFGHDVVDRYTDVWSDGRRVWLASRQDGVALLSLDDQGQLTHQATYRPSSPVSFSSLAGRGHMAFLASDSGGGVQILDLHNPLEPRHVASIHRKQGGHTSVDRIRIAEHWLYQVSANSTRLKVFDISDPEHPRLATEVDTPDQLGLSDVVVTPGRLYLAGRAGPDGAGAVYFFDTSSSDTGQLEIRPRGQLETGPNTTSIDVTPDQRFLIVSHRERGGSISIFDMEDAAGPALIAEMDAADYEINSYSAGRVRVEEQVVYVAWHQGGVQLIDLDTVDLLGWTQRIGAFGTAPGISPMQGFVGNVSVFPSARAPHRVLLVDSKWGLYVVDATAVLPKAPGEYE